MSQKVVKCFSFEERFRSRLTFSDPTKIRLSSDDKTRPRLQLKSQSYNRATGAQVYPLDTDLTVTTRVENPQTLKALLGFDPLPRDTKQPAGTSIGYKLNDGTDDRYWDGGAWAVAGATDWNTAAEVTANIAAFPTAAQKFGLVINLVTTDPSVSPALYTVDVLMDCEIDYFKSIIADAVIPSLRAGIAIPVDYAVGAPGGVFVSLSDLETEYNISSIEGVYDHDSDPTHTTNLYSAFDPVSKVITLTASVAQGKALWIRFTAEPEVALNWSSQDYIEVEKIPAVVIDSIDIVGNDVWGQAAVKDAVAQQATVKRFPFRLRLELGVRLIAEKNRTLLAMQDRALIHAASTPLLPWPAVDEEISMRTGSEGLFRPKPNLGDKHEINYTLTLDNVHLFLRPEETKSLVQQLNFTFITPDLEGGPRWTSTKADPF